jgi:hypothetical protein
MNKIYTLGLSLAAVALMTGCGGGDSSDEVSTATTSSAPAVEITDSQSASNAIASISTSGTSASGNVPAAPARQAPSLYESSYNGSCENGGSYTIDENSASFTDCEMGGSSISGSYTYSTSLSGDITEMKYKTQNFSISNAETQTLLNYSLDYKIKSTDSYYVYVNIDGLIDVKSQDYSIRAIYDDFTYSVEDKDHARIDGSYSLENSLYTCQNGRYDIQTLSSLDPTDNTGYTTTFDSGIISVNGVRIEFHEGATATVTYADGTSETISQTQTVRCN